MMHPSETLRSLVASKPPEELKSWAQQRLSGEDRMPLLYKGKEVEHPHEALAAVFGLDQEVLTPEKRGAVIEGLKKTCRTIQEEWVDGKSTPQSTQQAVHWAEVISIAKPEELRKDARMLLEACLMAPQEAQSALPEIAAAATDFAETGEPDLVLWNKLLGKPQTAALAFRRLLAIESFPQMSQHWLTLLKRRVQDQWPANVRLLTSTLLSKAPSTTLAIQQLASMVTQSGLSKQAADELRLSKNDNVKELALEIEKHSVSFGLDSNSWIELLRQPSERALENLVRDKVQMISALFESKTREVDANWLNLSDFILTETKPKPRALQTFRFYGGELNYLPRHMPMNVLRKDMVAIVSAGRMIPKLQNKMPRTLVEIADEFTDAATIHAFNV